MGAENVAFLMIFPLLQPLCDPKICYKCVCGRGSAPDPAEGAHDAPPDPLVGWRGGYPLPTPHPRRRLRRLDPLACRRPPMFFFTNRTLAEVIIKIKVAHFFETRCSLYW